MKTSNSRCFLLPCATVFAHNNIAGRLRFVGLLLTALLLGCATSGDDGSNNNNQNGNSAPVAEAGGNRGTLTNSLIMLDGSQSSDPDSDALAFDWSFVSIPAGSAASLNNPESVIASFTPDIDGSYEILLVVEDGGLEDSVIITIVASTTGPYECVDLDVICVDDTVGASQEYTNIQSAVDLAQPGDVVLVHPGDYAGFRVSSGSSGTSSQRVTVTAYFGGVTLISPEAGTENMIRLQNANYVTIEGFSMDRSGFDASYDYDEACIAARDASVTSPMVGLHFFGNTLVGCALAGMYLSNVSDLQIIGNSIRETRTEVGGRGGMGIYLSNSQTDNAIVRDNLILDNEKEGIHMNGDSTVGGDGLQTGHLIERNVISGNTTNGLNMDGVQDITIINNVIMNNLRHGIRGYAIDGAAGPKDWVIINNTLYNNSDSPGKITAADDLGGHILFNNLIVDNGFNQFDINDAMFDELDNLYRSDEAALFIDAPGGDLRLKSGSAAINGGAISFMLESAPLVDLSLAVRDATPDVGAFEQGSELPTWYP